MPLICITIWLFGGPLPPSAEHPLAGPAAELVGWLLQHGHSGPKSSARHLDQALRGTEETYLDGGSRSCAVRFGALLLDPTFAHLARSPLYDNARYYLASALAQQGAYGRARHLLLEQISRDPPSAFRPLAFRKLVDLTLRSAQLEQTLSALSQLRFEPRLDERGEMAYLKGKALMRLGFFDRATEALSSVSRTSRLYAAANYLAGVIALEQGRADQAEERFCRLVHQPGGERYTYFLSDNAVRVVEYAWLALARLRHDGGSYGRALDTYRHIPSDSRLATRARYEAAWSTYRAGDFEGARRLLGDLLASATELDEGPAAELLMGYALLGDCLFDQARARFESLKNRLARLASALADRRFGSPSLPRNALPWATYRRTEARAVRLAERVDRANERAMWLKTELDRVAANARPRPPRKRALSDRLHIDLARAKWLHQRLADLHARLGAAENERSKLDALHQLQDRVSAAETRARNALVRLLAGQPTGVAATAPGPRTLPLGYLDAERKRLAGLQRRLAAQTRSAWRLRLAVDKGRAQRIAAQVAAWARQADLGRVDAVIGRKQALEAEVQNLAVGRYPLSLLSQLAEAGLLDESSEYWPYDGEYWPDEYE